MSESPPISRGRPTAYPSTDSLDAALRNGSTVHLRPVSADDKPLAHSFLEGVSQTSLGFRFFGAANLDWVTDWAVDVDYADRYAGIALVPEVHAPELNGDSDARTIGEFLHYRDQVLEPQMNIKDAMRLFDEAESEALAVIDAADKRNVIGLLTEAHALRRYSEELDQARRDLVGESL